MSEFAVTVRRRSDLGSEVSSAAAGPAMNSIVNRQRSLGPAMNSTVNRQRSLGPAMNSVAERRSMGPAMNSAPVIGTGLPAGPAMSSTPGIGTGPAMNSVAS